MDINHDGKIKSVKGDKIEVEILSKSACSTCPGRGFCSMSDQANKIINVTNKGEENYKVGENVQVSIKQKLGYKAVWISYGLPLVIFLILLISLPSFLKNELLIGLIILGAVIIYYVILYLCGKRIGRSFDFSIHKY
ncbi:MAG: SoxR reducing system RseC family protein [Bacteroidales bacterium]